MGEKNNLHKTHRKNNTMSKHTNHYLYRLHNTKNDKNYIGQTTNPKHRFYRCHYKHNPELLADIDKYGMAAFSAEIIARTSDRNFAAALEEHYIDEYDAIEHGYNTTRCFRVPVGLHRTEAANDKRRQAISRTVWMYDPSTGQSTRANPTRAKELAEQGWLNGRIKEDAVFKGSVKNKICDIAIPDGEGDYFKNNK